MSDDETVPRRTVLRGTGAAVGGTVATGVASGSPPDHAPAHGAEKDESDDRDGGRDRDADDVEVIAHRGFAGLYPENTVAAVEGASRGGQGRGAARRGADMVEVDIMPTSDGTIVVFHDNRLAERDGGERGLTDRSGLVWEQSTEYVTGAEVLESGETVPTLVEVMEAIPPHVGVNLEFKNPGSLDTRFGKNLSGSALETQKDLWRSFTERALDIAADYRNDILVSSFYEAAIATVRETDADVPVAFLFWDDIELGLDVTRTYDCEAMNVPYNMVQGAPFFGDDYYTSGPFADVDLVAVAENEDRTLNTWTVQTWYQAEQLRNAGVDGIIADYPGLL